jgi:hypothetical protein
MIVREIEIATEELGEDIVGIVETTESDATSASRETTATASTSGAIAHASLQAFLAELIVNP